MTDRERTESIPELSTPVYESLKDLHLDIPITQNGRAVCAIVAPDIYSADAKKLQLAIEHKNGIKVPIVSDTAPEAAVPFVNNLIILGNRSTSRISSQLYDHFYSLMDLKYPGPKGYSVRSLHNPYGNGYSAILVGGSDKEGVEAGVNAFIAHLKELPATDPKNFSIGWTMMTRLGEGLVVPTDIKDFETWEASNRYGSVGYFGWNSISKRMAMYYMTGDPFHSREAIRLSFPDAQALKEIEEIDGERIENKKDPLAGPYHYNATMMILFWELIEESPVFSDMERLNVTNAFARRLEHEGTTPFDKNTYRLDAIPSSVGSRHVQWSALSIFTIGRYFNKYYPSPMWAQAERAGQLAFAPLHSHSYLEGHGDQGSYNTGLAPVLTYMLLTGDRKPLENGVLEELLKGQEILMNGKHKELALNTAALDFLNKTAYVTGDGRWITYRKRTGLDTDIFRLGQSYWPEDDIKPVEPLDLVGKWVVKGMPEKMWEKRKNHFTLDQSFENMSYRSSPDSCGDYVLLKGFNAAYSNPYHTLAIIELRLNGSTLLSGYNNQILVNADGMVEPEVPMDAALLYHEVIGDVATVVAKVSLPYTKWQRTLVQRTGKYVLLADDLTFRSDIKSGQSEMVANVETQWEMTGYTWMPESNYYVIQTGNTEPTVSFELHPSEIMDVKNEKAASMIWSKNVKSGQNKVLFTLIGQNLVGDDEKLANLQLSDNAAILLMPEPAIAAVGTYKGLEGELVLLSEKNLFGHAVTKGGIDKTLLSSDLPIDVDWDMEQGKMFLINPEQINLTLNIASSEIKLNGKTVKGKKAGGAYMFNVSAGRHIITGAKPLHSSKASLSSQLGLLLKQAQYSRRVHLAGSKTITPIKVPELATVFNAEIGGFPIESIVIPSVHGDLLCTATGKTITLLKEDGQIERTMSTKGNVRVLNWWAEYKILLVGCDNEEVIGFDESGQKKWSFTSVMDPAVYEAGKPYWFKSRDPGIYGLYSGDFDNGKSRAFIGSACTLEIIDENGQLIKRTPVFWGPGCQFLMVNASDGSKNLLVGRWRNGYNTLAVINSKKMEEIDRGYNTVPAGHTFIDGWTSMNRYDNFLTDLDHDGHREIISAINGTWNRITVYTEDGKPLYNAQFGPGIKGPRTNLRMMDVGDLDGDGKQEIVAGLSAGFVNVLNGKAEKVWAKLLPSPPTVLKIVKEPGITWICVGCEDGTIFALDAGGKILKKAKIAGKPVDINLMDHPRGRIVVLTTETGVLSGFSIK